MVYTTASAFFEAIWDAGVTHCFVNLGSDHPALLEAIVKGQREHRDAFPKIITCPNEMVALSMADGFARVSGRPQCVIVHVDVGTQALGQAVHNASCGRAPVLIFAGLSPYTLEGELRGSRSEYIHWIQDVPDQRQIVAQYCRYTGEIKTGLNVKQLVNRALQLAKSDPQGPVYLVGAREAMEQEIEPYQVQQEAWNRVIVGGLPEEAVKGLSQSLVEAEKPLLITGYSGRNRDAVIELVRLADTLPGLRVLDTGGSDMCFPFSHPASLGMRYGVEEYIREADFMLVIDCDVPFIPTRFKPRKDARIVHIDVDPLKGQMPLHYIGAQQQYRADSETPLRQLHQYISRNTSLSELVASEKFKTRGQDTHESHKKRLEGYSRLAARPSDNTLNTSFVSAAVRKACPNDTIWCVEAVTQTFAVADQLQVDIPGCWINCGGGGLGWSGGASLGVKLAADAEPGSDSGGKFVCQIVGDGSYMFSVPGSVYWIAQRYKIPTLTIVLNNNGWNASRHSLSVVHPDGEGSKVTNEELHISFKPTPDYAGIARAASGGKLWANRAETADELEILLPQAVDCVKKGTGAAVLEVKLGNLGAYHSKPKM